ncbi:28670_t:CDS:2 [Dentiscutata erythropus]|uniref:28670_t:CDS:1 n=1 Tax=Dentiscutata erythropus TaxID=1348616 RepID=A0A9N9HM70_9GLOM|nr:28670_t:CDS:2 [Dentiscutata erythropus]
MVLLIGRLANTFQSLICLLKGVLEEIINFDWLKIKGCIGSSISNVFIEISISIKLYHDWMNETKDKLPIYDSSKFSGQIKIGGNSVVYSAKYGEEMIVYKKLIDDEIRKFVNELKQHMAVRNDYIIGLLGIAIGDENMIVLQYANGGCLRDYLGKKIQKNVFTITWAELILIAEQIIFGLQGLHDTKITHGDLSSRNILVMKDNNNKFSKVKIADFGSASKFDDIKEIAIDGVEMLRLAVLGSSLGGAFLSQYKVDLNKCA